MVWKKVGVEKKRVARENRTVLLATKKATLPLSISFVLHSLIWLYTHVLATKKSRRESNLGLVFFLGTNLGLVAKKIELHHYAAPVVVL